MVLSLLTVGTEQPFPMFPKNLYFSDMSSTYPSTLGPNDDKKVYFSTWIYVPDLPTYIIYQVNDDIK